MLMSGVSLHAAFVSKQDIQNAYWANQETILNNGYKVTPDYVIGVGVSVVRGNKSIAWREAELLAANSVLKALGSTTEITDLPDYVNKTHAQKILAVYQALQYNKAELNNRITLDKITKKDGKRSLAVFVIAYFRSDIKCNITEKIAWNKIYQTLKSKPQIFDAFLFFEVASEQDRKNTAVFKDVFQKQKGRNFTSMFLGSPFSLEQRKQLKPHIVNHTENTPLNQMIDFVNSYPYDTASCRLIIEKFKALKLNRCAEQMERALELCLVLDAKEEEERIAAEKAAAEKAGAEKAAAEKSTAEKSAAEKSTAEKAAVEPASSSSEKTMTSVVIPVIPVVKPIAPVVTPVSSSVKSIAPAETSVVPAVKPVVPVVVPVVIPATPRVKPLTPVDAPVSSDKTVREFF